MWDTRGRPNGAGRLEKEPGEVRMNIGEPQRVIEIEPIEEDPVETPAADPAPPVEPQRVPVPG